jgi:hypothetical protein
MLTFELSLSGYGVVNASEATRGIELLQRELQRRPRSK